MGLPIISSAINAIGSATAIREESLDIGGISGDMPTNGVEGVKSFAKLPTDLSDDKVLALRQQVGDSKAKIRNAKEIAKHVDRLRDDQVEIVKLGTSNVLKQLKAVQTISGQRLKLAESFVDHQFKMSGDQRELSGYKETMQSGLIGRAQQTINLEVE